MDTTSHPEPTPAPAPTSSALAARRSRRRFRKAAAKAAQPQPQTGPAAAFSVDSTATPSRNRRLQRYVHRLAQRLAKGQPLRAQEVAFVEAVMGVNPGAAIPGLSPLAPEPVAAEPESEPAPACQGNHAGVASRRCPDCGELVA